MHFEQVKKDYGVGRVVGEELSNLSDDEFGRFRKQILDQIWVKTHDSKQVEKSKEFLKKLRQAGFKFKTISNGEGSSNAPV